MSFTLTCNECGGNECKIDATYQGRDYPIKIVAVCENEECGHEE